MNRHQKLAIVLPAIFVIYSALLFLLVPHAHAATENPPTGPQCKTTYTVVYKDPSKYDEAGTIDALKQNLSGIDFSAEVLDGHQWWTYIEIDRPDANSTSTLTIPTVSGTADRIVNETMLGMDGVLKVDSMISTWCT